MMERHRATTFSVVVPVYNEEAVLPEFYRRVTMALTATGEPYEVVFVDDGSSDGSLDLLRSFSEADPRVRVISFSRNFGHQAALFSGMCRARGAAVMLIDADLQDPPELLPTLAAKWREGNHVVYAVRERRKEGLAKRVAYAAFYRLLRQLSYIRIPLDSGDFSLLDRRVVDELSLMPERNKFLRGLRSWVGFRQTSVSYERDARFAGGTKYTLSKLTRLAFDGMVSYSYIPLRFSYALGALVSLLGFSLAGIYFIQRLLAEYYIPQGFTTIAILVLLMGGIQLLSIGLLGEYVGRIYDEVKRRPEFIERELIGFSEVRDSDSTRMPKRKGEYVAAPDGI